MAENKTVNDRLTVDEYVAEEITYLQQFGAWWKREAAHAGDEQTWPETMDYADWWEAYMTHEPSDTPEE